MLTPTCPNTAIKVYLFVCPLSYLYSWLKLTSVQINRKFKKILVAIDGSQESINAADYAISIAKETIITTAAKKHSSELILLHVMPSEVKFGHASGIFGVVPPEHAERMKQEAHKWFEKIRDKIVDNT